jgi:hypothetical protein
MDSGMCIQFARSGTRDSALSAHCVDGSGRWDYELMRVGEVLNVW